MSLNENESLNEVSEEDVFEVMGNNERLMGETRGRRSGCVLTACTEFLPENCPA